MNAPETPPGLTDKRHFRCLATALLLLSAGGRLSAEEEPARLREMVVTATPLPTEAGKFGRSLEVVSQEDIRASKAGSVPEMLESMTSVVASERGAPEVQADLSIRGSTFQQVLVAIDGLPATDAQTAHHNMDLPFPASALEQITVIPGPGSALFGPSAFGGTVNLVPRTPKESGIRFLSALGDFETHRLETTADVVHGREAITVSTAYTDSDGFRVGTGYEAVSIWGSSFTRFDGGGVRFSVGHTEKDFGARDFYATFPSREITSTTLLDLAPQVEFDSGWLLKAIARFRRHDDEFILIESNPSFYRNEHRTDGFTERVTAVSPEWAAGATAFGLERSDSRLESTNLGDRDAFTTSAFLEHRLSGEQWSADVGLRADDHEDWGTEVSPSLSLSVSPKDGLRLRAAGDRGIRPPSFTELYYTDPRNRGNPDLDPEEVWGMETGFDFDVPDVGTVSATYFLRESRKLIDWVRAGAADPWEARNIGEATVQGAEFLVSRSAGPIRLSWSYRYTDIDADSGGLTSKYALNVPRHEPGAMLALRETRGFSASVSLKYRDVPTLDRYWLLSARAAQRWKAVTFFVRGRNLLDEDYEEIPGVPTAGIYAETGVELDW